MAAEWRREVEAVLVEDAEMPDCYGIGYLRDQQLMLVTLGIKLGLEAAHQKCNERDCDCTIAVRGLDPTSILKGPQGRDDNE